MILHAGLDCSGTPDLRGTARGHSPYVVTLAAVSAPERLAALLRDLRFQFGMAQREEFHGHEMSEAMLAAVLERVMESEWIVGALLIDKAMTQQLRPASELPAVTDFQIRSALTLAEAFFARYALAELRCDEDIHGRERQKEFITGVKRLHRSVWSEGRLRVTFLPSAKSDLIQLADIIAYGLGILTRGTVQDAILRRRLQAIQENPANIIQGPRAWEE